MLHRILISIFRLLLVPVVKNIVDCLAAHVISLVLILFLLLVVTFTVKQHLGMRALLHITLMIHCGMELIVIVKALAVMTLLNLSSIIS